MSTIRNYPTQWTKERITKLKKLAGQGMNFGEIAEQLGTTRMAAYSKWYNSEYPETMGKEKHSARHRRVAERTGRFWKLGSANPRENAISMRKDYIKMTARLMYVHGPYCFAPFYLDIPGGR